MHSRARIVFESDAWLTVKIATCQIAEWGMRLQILLVWKIVFHIAWEFVCEKYAAFKQCKKTMRK